MKALERVRSRPLLAMFLALWLAYGLAAAWTTARVGATGDEPFYFLAADSLVRGEGFELSRRIAAIGTSSYAPDPPVSPEAYVAQTAPSLRSTGRYPLHDLGLSLVIAVPLALGGRSLVILLLAGTMAAAVVLGVRAARELGIERGPALAGGALAGLAVPALTYSGQVFPDALAALPVAAAICALVGALPRVWLGVAAAALPFLHLRYWPIAVGLMLAGLLLGRVHRGNVVRQLLPLIVAIVAMAAIDGLVYGLAVPHAGFVLFFHEGAAGPVAAFTAHDAAGLFGLFFDRSRGLIPAAPIALLGFVGVGALLRTRTGRVLLLAITPYLLVVSLLDWTGAYAPHARYLAPLAAMSVVLIGRGIVWASAAAIAFLSGWTALQSGIYVVAPELRYDRLGQRPLADQAWTGVVGFAPSALFPIVSEASVQLIVLLMVAAALMLAGAWPVPPVRRAALGRRVA